MGLCCRLTSKANGRECHLCDSRKTEHAHPAHFLTDLHNPNNVTCWQSDVIAAGQVSILCTHQSHVSTKKYPKIVNKMSLKNYLKILTILNTCL
jgi:hypothetical protein